MSKLGLRGDSGSGVRARVCGAALVAAGCGSANVLSSTDELPEEARRPAAVRTLPGSTNVSDAPGFELSFESQSSAAVLGTRAFIAYRAGDPRYVDYVATTRGREDRRTCAGASELSYSVGSPPSQTYRRERIDPPEGIAVLAGPVAMTAFSSAVFFSALASPNDRWQAALNDGDCVRTSQEPSSELPRSLAQAGALAGACIMNLPGHGVSCFRRGNDTFEGGSLAATSSHVYAAYRDATRNDVALFRAGSDGDFVEMRLPESARADHDVSLAASGPQLYLAYLLGSRVVLRVFDETTGTWNAPRIVAEDANRRMVPAVRRRPALAVKSFTFAVLPGEPTPTLVFFWQRRVGSTQKTTLRGALCDLTRSGACDAPLHLRVSNASNNFLPSIATASAVAADGSRTHRHVLSFWSDRGRRDGQVRLRVAEFDREGWAERWANDSVQRPCPILDAGAPADWGLSDASFVIGQDTATPTIYRALTDSTQGACTSSAFRATHQHVSVLTITR
jgi:hypothetical protein